MKRLMVLTTLAAMATATGALAQTTPAPEAQPAETPPAAPAPAATDPAMPAPAATGSEMSAPAITPPEGYVEQQTTFTTENLDGATVYDASGADIGEVHGLVFANGGNSASNAMPATDAPATETTGGPAPAMTPLEGGATDSATAPMTDSDSQNPESGTQTGDAERVQSTTPDTMAGSADQTTATPDATEMPAAVDATTITHAIIDVGGFLGMGEHRVSVPVEDLKVYSKDDDLRIYLPWSREQLMALPEYDETAAQPG